MDLNTLRLLAGISSAPAAILQQTALAPVIEKEEEPEQPETADDSELMAFIKPLAAQAADLEGDDLEALLVKIYKAGVEDGQQEEEVKEQMAMSDDLAAKKIADKIKGTPNLTVPSVEGMVKRYLPMVGKHDTDVKYLTAQVVSILQDLGMMEASCCDK